MISKPSQKSRTFTSEIIAQFLQFTKSTSWSPNSWLKASGFQSSDFSFLCTPETSTGCGKKNIPLRKYFELRAKEWNRRVSWGLTFLVHDDLLFLPSFRIYGFQLVTYSKWKLLLLHYTSLSPLGMYHGNHFCCPGIYHYFEVRGQKLTNVAFRILPHSENEKKKKSRQFHNLSLPQAASKV